jgi:arylformamidase
MSEQGFTGGKLMPSDWIDVSVPIKTGMVCWPGDATVRVERVMDMGRGDPANVSTLTMTVHNGTHMDAPLHFIAAGASLDNVPFVATVGRARVIEIADPESIKPQDLRPHRIRRGERILFKTRNSTRCWATDSFVTDYVYITREAAAFLTERGVRTVGIDYLSVGAFDGDGAETHVTLLEAGVWLIEGLDLARVAPGKYDLICLPMRIVGAEGAPARAVLRPARNRKRRVTGG